MKTWIKNLTTLLCVLICATACQKDKSGPKNDGSSSGGGSFGDESSMILLQWAANDLATEIANASPEIFAKLPQGWTQQKLADVIRNVEPRKENRENYKVPEISRHGQRLMFNYSKKSDGTPFITATRLFTDSYSHYEVNTRPKQEFFFTLNQIKLKLAHEASHLMGLGLSKKTDMPEARKFAKALMESLDSDNVECAPLSAPPIEVYDPLESGAVAFDLNGEATLKNSTRAYVFNRPSGKAAVPQNLSVACATIDPKNPVKNDDFYFNGQCPKVEAGSSGTISVFAPKSYDEKFEMNTILKAIQTGVRSYGFKEGYFSWDLVDLRRAVLTDEGYKSNLRIERPADSNSSFSSYLDFSVKKSSSDIFEMETFPPLHQDTWGFYRSQGKARIAMSFKNGQVAEANLIILRPFNAWLGDEKPKEINIQIPLKCVRSFKPL